ncbi:MAG: diguanylate cyclase [Desulfovermiculus sp.]|nr:diguanylate cyclase [Desulfovermiculus sp.]
MRLSDNILELLNIIYRLQHGKFLTVNPAMAKRFGLTQEELTGKTYHQVMPEELADKRIMDAEKSMNDKEFIYFEDERQGRYLQNYYVPMTPSGQQRAFQIISRDITARIQDEQAKAEQKALLEAIFVNVPLILMLVDSERRIQQINGFATQFAKRPAEDMLGLRGGEALRCLHALDHSDGCGFEEHCRHCVIRKTVLDTLEQGKTYLQVEAPYTFYLDGQSRNLTLLVSSTPVTFRNSRMALVTLQDISERKQFEEQLKYLSLHDQLTGIYNRAYLENELYRLNISREHPISIISVDLDGLKLVNDTLGHDHGDNLLQVCAKMLQESLRDSDIVARAGGDEFVILLPGTELQTGEKIVQRIQREIKNYNQLHKGQIPLSLSIGLACAENEQHDLTEVLKQADDLMYRDKLNRNITSRSQIMTALMAALEERDFITSGHVQRLEELCVKLGKEVELSVNQLSNLNLLAQVHDLGKVGIPDHILFKPGPLNEAEWEIMRQHPEKGHRIALASTDLAGIADLILKHHERWDGQGYPLGFQGEEIPIECRILAIVDAFDSMVNDRPYRKSMPVAEALVELQRCAGSQFDPQLVKIFGEIMSEPGNTMKRLAEKNLCRFFA